MYKYIIYIVTLLSLIQPLANANTVKKPYQHDFILVNKSYSNDLYRSINLAQSLDKHYKSDDPFYIIVPQKDLKLFQDTYQSALDNNSLKKLPIFITDEEVLKDCHEDIEKIMNIHGWDEQQIVKMCISQTGLAKDYLTLDSDLYFVKDFDKSIFYTDNHQLRIVLRAVSALGEESMYTPSELIAKFLNIRNSYQNFVYGIALWDSDILKQLLAYANKQNIKSFSQMIEKVPYEMQWYGMYINEFMPEKLHPLSINLFIYYGLYACKHYAIDLKERGYVFDHAIGIILNSSQNYKQLTLEELCRNRIR